MKSSFSLRNITTRTTYATGATVTAGPDVSATYPLGLFREDYQYNATSAATPDFLDEHNGRFCITPEYPKGIYCYFATVDENWNSAYPYVVGPTFYGVKSAVKVTSITEIVAIYKPSTSIANKYLDADKMNVYPNPASDAIAIQLNDLTSNTIALELYDLTGKLLQTTHLLQGSTIAYFDTRTLYEGTYLIKIVNDGNVITKKIVVAK